MRSTRGRFRTFLKTDRTMSGKLLDPWNPDSYNGNPFATDSGKLCLNHVRGSVAAQLQRLSASAAHSDSALQKFAAL